MQIKQTERENGVKYCKKCRLKKSHHLYKIIL
nr:MAG TPA: hypothetical protein [Caudoviricetes sp.]